MTKINYIGIELLLHALFSPDLASLDFSLFLNLKKCHTGNKYTSDLKIIVSTNSYFKELDDESTYTSDTKNP